MDYVVGSGPAGVACARALLNRGRQVTMIDGGIVLEAGRAELVATLRSKPLEAWTAEQHASYRKGMTIQAGELPQKLVYGSDFAYREADEQLGVHYLKVGLRPSLARGGLSNVWGAAMMPYLQQDLHAWPFPLAHFERHYAAALELTGLAACHDELETHFPLYSQRLTNLSPSAQANQVLSRMGQHRAALRGRGIHFGRSRLAVRGTAPNETGGCVYCRLCMYGCPYNYIYSAADTVTELQRDSRFNYQPGAVVTRVNEHAGGVNILGHDRLSHTEVSWQGERVFLAAGAIATTGILLRSLGAYDKEVSLKDSQYFLVPLVLLKKVEGVQEEMLHALSQVFIEMVPENSERSVHIQVYSNSELINEAVAQQFGPLRRPLNWLVNNLQQRLLIAQGFLHSDDSSRISVRLKKEGGRERLELAADINPSARRRVKAVVRKLFRESLRIGAVPLEPLLKVAEPGRSFHAGGSFPMRARPAEFETDLWGRPWCWKRVHAVDATIFPSIPATTITLSVMANAHRIGWETGKD